MKFKILFFVFFCLFSGACESNITKEKFELAISMIKSGDQTNKEKGYEYLEHRRLNAYMLTKLAEELDNNSVFVMDGVCQLKIFTNLHLRVSRAKLDQHEFYVNQKNDPVPITIGCAVNYILNNIINMPIYYDTQFKSVYKNFAGKVNKDWVMANVHFFEWSETGQKYILNKHAFLIGIPYAKLKLMAKSEINEKLLQRIKFSGRRESEKMTKKEQTQIIRNAFEKKMLDQVLSIAKKYGYPKKISKAQFNALYAY